MATTNREYFEREKFISNNRTNTEAKIKVCAGSAKQLQKLLGQEQKLACTYWEDGAHDTARIIRAVNVPLIETALREVSR